MWSYARACFEPFQQSLSLSTIKTKSLFLVFNGIKALFAFLELDRTFVFRQSCTFTCGTPQYFRSISSIKLLYYSYHIRIPMWFVHVIHERVHYLICVARWSVHLRSSPIRFFLCFHLTSIATVSSFARRRRDNY